MFENIIGSLVGGVFTVVGVLVGGYIAKSNSSKQESKRLLVEFYAEVFSNYAQFVSNMSISSIHLLVASIEKAKLFCSQESNTILTELEYSVTDPSPDISKCGDLIRNLRLSAKKDVGNT